MDMYVVKNSLSVVTRPLPKNVAENIRDQFNRDYQTDDYLIEIYDPKRAFSFD